MKEKLEIYPNSATQIVFNLFCSPSDDKKYCLNLLI
jgi:hypothetical protein